MRSATRHTAARRSNARLWLGQPSQRALLLFSPTYLRSLLYCRWAQVRLGRVPPRPSLVGGRQLTAPGAPSLRPSPTPITCRHKIRTRQSCLHRKRVAAISARERMDVHQLPSSRRSLYRRSQPPRRPVLSLQTTSLSLAPGTINFRSGGPLPDQPVAAIFICFLFWNTRSELLERRKLERRLQQPPTHGGSATFDATRFYAGRVNQVCRILIIWTRRLLNCFGLNLACWHILRGINVSSSLLNSLCCCSVC